MYRAEAGVVNMLIPESVLTDFFLRTDLINLKGNRNSRNDKNIIKVASNTHPTKS